MWTRTQILVLSLAAGLSHGCAPLRTVLGRTSQTTQSSAQDRYFEASVPQPLFRLEDHPSLVALAHQIDDQEENLLAPVSVTANPPISKEPDKKPDKAEARVRPAAPHSEPTILQNIPGPRADDRLLELLQKDIDKAVEQPSDQRRLQFSKAVTENVRVRYLIDRFSKGHREFFAKLLARSGRYLPMMSKVLREEGLPEEFAYLALIESGFSNHALSRSGAAGLWQFVPTTARKYGLRIDRWIDERRDPVKATHAAAAYLKDLHAYFGKWHLATAAYNAGQGTIDKAMQVSDKKNVWGLSEKARLSEETRNFVPKFVAVSLIAASPAKYGFQNLAYETAVDYEEVEVRGMLKLKTAAEMAGTNVDTIQELNPALLRGYTPPNENGFRLKLPVSSSSLFAQAYQQVNETEHVQVITHEVRKGETLFSIARRYGQEVRSLMELNGLTTQKLRIGQRLRIILEGLRGKLG